MADRLNSLRLLLVDDEAAFRAVLVKRMRRQGIDPFQAADGAGGLRILSRQPVDVVVLDVRMPGMDGIDTLREIKRRHPHTEVILLTGHANTREGLEGIQAGAFDYLSKPVDIDHLWEKIKQAFEKKAVLEALRQDSQYRLHMAQQMAASERLAALGTLAAGVAHEINNPLAIINEAAGYLGTLLQKPELEDVPYREGMVNAVGKIATGVARARTITHQLLGGVRPDSPGLARVRPDELVDETLALVRAEAEDKGIAVARQSPPMAAVWIEADRLRQVLINLLVNAIHATQRGGRIVVGIEAGDGRLRFSVADSGKGIPGENLERIFEPFFSDQPPGEGTGLGLFVTRQIVDRMGGTITVRSQVGRGTTMTVAVPHRCGDPGAARGPGAPVCGQEARP